MVSHSLLSGPSINTPPESIGLITPPLISTPKMAYPPTGKRGWTISKSSWKKTSGIWHQCKSRLSHLRCAVCPPTIKSVESGISTSNLTELLVLIGFLHQCASSNCSTNTSSIKTQPRETAGLPSVHITTSRRKLIRHPSGVRFNSSS